MNTLPGKRQAYSVELNNLIMEDLEERARFFSVPATQMIEAGITHLIYSNPDRIKSIIDEHMREFLR